MTLIDEKILTDLADLSAPGEESLLVQLFEIFEDTTPQLIVELKSAATRGATETVSRTAHRIKGSALNIGARQMAEHCSTLEKSAGQQSPEENTLLAHMIEKSFARSREEIANWIARKI